MVAASGAALVAMVARICANNQKYAPQHQLARGLVERADALRRDLMTARERDEAAFAEVVVASALPKDDPNRRERLETALSRAASEPLHAAKLALGVLRASARLLEIPNKNLTSDVGCAAEFAAAAVFACAYNVRINHRFMKDGAAIHSQDVELARYERETHALLHAIRERV